MEKNMEQHRLAVIDMGTNTFNLLIAETDGEGMKELYFEKIPVKLGKEGIREGFITPQAWLRAVEAMIRYREIAGRYGVQEITAFGTSALRTARNSSELLTAIRETTGIKAEIISGEEEALLIYNGVIRSVHPAGTFLIMDVGGGSVEFILASQHKGILWKNSYPLGIARLLEQFDLYDPVTEENVHTLEDHFDRHLPELWKTVAQYRPATLVGSAGTFDTLRALAAGKGWLKDNSRSWQEIPLEVYRKVHNMLLLSGASQREKMKGMEPFRVEMIVPASIFVNFVLGKTGTGTLIQSYYSLKEGVVFRLMETRQDHKKQ